MPFGAHLAHKAKKTAVTAPNHGRSNRLFYARRKITSAILSAALSSASFMAWA